MKLLNILHVEDNELISTITGEYLSMFEHKVTSCMDVTSGLKQLEENEFDVILLDLAMPTLTGYDFICELKNKPNILNKIHILTATDLTDEEKLELYDKGVKKILLKPLKAEELLEQIKN